MATSPRDAAIERLFSIAGDIQRPKHEPLQSDTVCHLLMVKYGQLLTFTFVTRISPKEAKGKKRE